MAFLVATPVYFWWRVRRSRGNPPGDRWLACAWRTQRAEVLCVAALFVADAAILAIALGA